MEGAWFLSSRRGRQDSPIGGSIRLDEWPGKRSADHDIDRAKRSIGQLFLDLKRFRRRRMDWARWRGDQILYRSPFLAVLLIGLFLSSLFAIVRVDQKERDP